MAGACGVEVYAAMAANRGVRGLCADGAVPGQVAEALCAVACAGLSAGDRKAAVRRVVELAVLGERALQSHTAAASADGAIDHLETLLSAVAEETGVHKLDVTCAKEVLRRSGARALASRLSRASQLRNRLCHPDRALVADIRAHFADSSSSSDDTAEASQAPALGEISGKVSVGSSSRLLTVEDHLRRLEARITRLEDIADRDALDVWLGEAKQPPDFAGVRTEEPLGMCAVDVVLPKAVEVPQVQLGNLMKASDGSEVADVYVGEDEIQDEASDCCGRQQGEGIEEGPP